jgi:CheY-like chemotaxis protein/DNA-binding SARP family transcriptional activator
MTLLRIRLFGGLSAIDHRGNALSIGNRKARALIVYLALTGERGSIAQAGELIFGSPGEAAVRALVRDVQYALRFLPPDIVLEDTDSIRFNHDNVTVDTQRFDQLAGAESINAIREAAELYRGNLLEGFTSEIRSFDDWLAEQRLTYWRSGVAIFGRLLAAQIKAGWWENAVDTASRLLSLDPSQEVVHRALMRLQLEQGRPDSALRRYQECADILRRDFNREPSAETEKVRDEIVASLDRTPAPREVQGNRIDGPVLILLVEDDAVSSAIVEGFLVDAGYEVVTVADGGEALIEIGRRGFDLLILDINLPTLSGLRLFEIMIQKGIDTPAIFITGVAGPEVEARSLELGAADFLRKPIRKEMLLPRIRGILNRRERAAL